MNPKRKNIYLWILLIFLIACGMASCSTTHKLKTAEFKYSDSTATKTAQQIQVLKKDSSGYKKNDSSFKELITINFDTAALVPGEVNTEPANDYEAAELKPLRGPYVYNIAGNTITSPRKINSATIERSGYISNLQIINVTQSDSSQKNTSEVVHVVKDEKKIAKEKTSRRTPFLICLLLLLLVVAAALYALRRYKII